MVGAWNVTRFYAVLTFCINLTVKEIFKIVFLLETTLFFSRYHPSRVACMDYPGCYWLSAYQILFVGVSILSQLGAWIFLSMVHKIRNFKRYLCCTSMENLLTIHIFGISVKICISPCNFSTQLLLIKIRLINAKSPIQPRWHPSFPEILEKSKLSTIISGQSLYIFKIYLCSDVPCYPVHLTA